MIRYSHQSTQRMSVPSVCRAGLCCANRQTCPLRPNLPRLGFTATAAISAATPPTMWTTPEPAKSAAPQPASSGKPSPANR